MISLSIYKIGVPMGLFVYYLYLCSVEIIKKLLFLVVFNLLYKNLNVYKQS